MLRAIGANVRTRMSAELFAELVCGRAVRAHKPARCAKKKYVYEKRCVDALIEDGERVVAAGKNTIQT